METNIFTLSEPSLSNIFPLLILKNYLILKVVYLKYLDDLSIGHLFIGKLEV